MLIYYFIVDLKIKRNFMLFTRNYLALCMIILASQFAMAQDTLVFINGREIPASNIKLQDDQVIYNSLKRPGKIKSAESYNIFSIKYASGDETLIYKPDTLIDDLSIEEMRMFVKGQQDALAYYNTTAVTVASSAIGLASGFTLQFFALAPPAIFATIVGASSPNMDRQPVRNKELLESPAYRSGYEAKARNMKIKKALIFGLGGALVGYAGFRVLEANE